MNRRKINSKWNKSFLIMRFMITLIRKFKSLWKGEILFYNNFPRNTYRKQTLLWKIYMNPLFKLMNYIRKNITNHGMWQFQGNLRITLWRSFFGQIQFIWRKIKFLKPCMKIPYQNLIKMTKRGQVSKFKKSPDKTIV